MPNDDARYCCSYFHIVLSKNNLAGFLPLAGPGSQLSAVMKKKNMSRSTAEQRLERYFMRSVRQGRVLSLQDLQLYIKRNGLHVKSEYLRHLRRRFKATAIFERIKTRPPAYMTNAIPRLGQVQVDVGFFHERWAKFNRGYKGESLPHRINRF